MNRSVHRHKQKLDALFENVSAIDDPNFKNEWARYLCVRTSGFVETSVRTILSKHAEDRASPAVANYVASKLDRFTSANKANIREELAYFDPEWGRRFENGVTDELRDSLNSVIGNRHRIVHGRDVGLSYHRMK